MRRCAMRLRRMWTHRLRSRGSAAAERRQKGRELIMDTVDITPTPVEYAAIAQRIITAAYGLECHDLTKYQVIWAWTAAERAAERIGTPIQDLPSRLGCELLRMYLARAHTVTDRPVTVSTTYADLNGAAGE